MITASPLVFQTNPGLGCSSVHIQEAGAAVTSTGRQKAEAVAAAAAATRHVVGAAAVAAAAAAGAAAGVSAVSSRAVMRSGTHCAEFQLLKMDERDGGRGIRIGITRPRRVTDSELNGAGAARISAAWLPQAQPKISRAELMGAKVSSG